VRVRSTGEGRFQQVVQVGRHRLFADEPVTYGGLDSGPSPYDFLSAGLAACTSMTLALYAERKGWQIPPFTVDVRHAKAHATDCENCVEGGGNKIDHFDRRIMFESDPGEAAVEKAIEIADKCPVHRTLESSSVVVTSVGTSFAGS
jgi:putative redox protein